VPVPTDVPILVRRNRPEKEPANQLSPHRVFKNSRRLSIARFPLFTYLELDGNLSSISAAIEAVCRRTSQGVNRDSGPKIRAPKIL
jgi:hypothetical protein